MFKKILMFKKIIITDLTGKNDSMETLIFFWNIRVEYPEIFKQALNFFIQLSMTNL